jgi:GT2 family glycosyltransferase
MTELDLSICIVNWNTGKLLKECLISIEECQLDLQYEVIVVDNASTDDSLSLVKESFPGLPIIVMNNNSGFSTANNVAICSSEGRYILLLNPDTIIKPDTLETMVSFMDTHSQVGICGCRLVNPATKKIELSARAFPTNLSLLWNLSYIDRLFPQSAFFSAYLMTYQESDKPYEVDWVTGACLMARRYAVKQVGGLDEGFFMYCEDIDWCYRFKQAGWLIFYLPKVEIYHHRGQSSKLKRKSATADLSIWGAQQYTRSILYFYKKHYDSVQTQLLRFILVATAVVKGVLWLSLGILYYGWRSGVGRATSYLSTIVTACSFRP